MELKILNEKFAVCKINRIEDVRFEDEYYFIGKTDDELSLVCIESSVPETYISCEKGWRGIKIVGILDFTLVGILARISSILAENGISIFAISTFNTDYILVKEEDFSKTIEILGQNNTIS